MCVRVQEITNQLKKTELLPKSVYAGVWSKFFVSHDHCRSSPTSDASNPLNTTRTPSREPSSTLHPTLIVCGPRVRARTSSVGARRSGAREGRTRVQRHPKTGRNGANTRGHVRRRSRHSKQHGAVLGSEWARCAAHRQVREVINVCTCVLRVYRQAFFICP